MLSCFVGIDMEIPAFVDHEKREKNMRVRYLCPDYIPTISWLYHNCVTIINVHML